MGLIESDAWRQFLEATYDMRGTLIRGITDDDLADLVVLSHTGSDAERHCADRLLWTCLGLGISVPPVERDGTQFEFPPAEPPTRAPRQRAETDVPEEVFVDAEIRYPIEGGGFLAIGPGPVRVSTTAQIEEPDVGGDSDIVRARLVVADERGDAWATERPVPAHEFLRYLSDPGVLSPRAAPWLEGLRCRADESEIRPACTWLGGVGFVPFVYWTEYFQCVIDLFVEPRGVAASGLVIRVNATAIGGIQQYPTPECIVRVPMFARHVLMPHGLGIGPAAAKPRSPRFTSVGPGEPQASVRRIAE